MKTPKTPADHLRIAREQLTEKAKWLRDCAKGQPAGSVLRGSLMQLAAELKSIETNALRCAHEALS